MIRIVMDRQPIGAPRMTQRDKWAKRKCVVDYFAWRDELKLRAGKLPPVETIRKVRIVATLEPAASLSKKKRLALLDSPHRAKPDSDNIAKAVLDSLFVEDSGIHHLEVEKRWGKAGCLVVEIETE